MKQVITSLLAVSSFAFIAGLQSCGGEEKKSDTAEVTTPEDTDEDEVDQNTEKVVEKRLPTPKEFFEIIKQIGGKSRPELTMDPKLAETYTDNNMRALAFGMYSADIAYLSNYGISGNTLKYLTVLEKMATSMDIGGIFDKELQSRIEANTGDLDSLLALSDIVYYKSVEYLHMDQAEDILGLMLAGGWIESMYIVTNIAGEYDDTKPVFENLRGQVYVLETIQEYLMPYTENNDFVIQVYGNLDELKGFYYEAGVNETKTEIKEVNGKKVITGGQEIKMTKETYGKVVGKIAEIRKLVIANEL